MDVLDAIKKRRSIRAFERKPLKEDEINTIIDALIWAPSAGNLQARKFFLVTNQEIKKQLVKAAFNQYFLEEAGLVIVGCVEEFIKYRYGDRGLNLYGPQDVAASIQNASLAAVSLGLGSVWVGAFDEKKVSKVMGISSDLRPVAMLAVGYPKENPIPPERRPISELIEFVD